MLVLLYHNASVTRHNPHLVRQQPSFMNDM